MGNALYASVPTPRGGRIVVLLDQKGKVRETLPYECESEAEAQEYAKSYSRLYS